MQSYKYMRSRCGARDGLALIMVLAFIVLLTILVVSYITFSGLNHTSTASYSKSIQAQEIAQGGIQDILGDLHQEIVAGSTTQNGGNSTNPSVYIPTINFTAVPARIGYTAASWGTDTTPPTASPSTLSPSLIRVSRATNNSSTYASAAFFTQMANSTGYYTNNLTAIPGGTILSRASTNSAGTASPSANGRLISIARWNKPFLLATNAAAVPTPFSNAPPDWVYVTRAGSQALNGSQVGNLLQSNNLTNTGSSQGSPIVGRYAFVMYDEGALLDANAAGYLSAATNNYTAGVTPSYTNVVSGTITNVIETLSGKSYLSYADLTQLPGFAGKQSAVDAFVKWRNAGGLAGATTGTAYLGAMATNAASGFLTFTYHPNGATTNYDGPLVGRQDLINYLANYDATNSTSTSQALPYLGTFTREVNASSYFPPVDSGSIPGYSTSLASAMASSPPVTYHSSMESLSSTNCDFANVRFATPSSVTHYNDDASTSTYSVLAGDPLIQRRFSLARIGWLKSTALGGVDPGGTNPTTGSGPSTTYATAIKACFGLVWGSPGSTSQTSSTSTTLANGGNPCWNYVGSTGSSLPSSIETLAQVAAENPPREPNFFELLKAAILSGSVGQEPGPAGYSNGTVGGSYDPGSPPTTANQNGPCGFYCYSFDGHTASSTPTVFAPATIPDIQIMQIGANIIDQYGSDGYPTAIYFRYLSGTGPLAFDPVLGPASNTSVNYGLYGPVDMVFGDKNLPLLTRVSQSWVTTLGNGPTGNPTDGTYNSVNQMMNLDQPELWNPHQMPGTALSNVPKYFQIRAYGSDFSYWAYQGTTGKTWTSGNSQVTYYYQGSASAGGSGETCTAGTLNFTDANAGKNSSFYASPKFLTVDGIAGVTATSPNSTNMPPTASGQTGWEYPYYSSDGASHFVAFSTGETPTSGTVSPYQPYYYNSANGTSYGSGALPITYVLGWTDGATMGTGNFHPFCYFTGAFCTNYNTVNNGAGERGSCLPRSSSPFEWLVIDPRTSRFSLQATYFAGSGAATNATLFPTAATHTTVSGYIPYLASLGFNPSYTSSQIPNGGTPQDWAVNSTSASVNTAYPASVTTYFSYADPDGVVRPGDGYFANSANGDGLLLLTNSILPSTAGAGKALGDTKTGTFVDSVPATAANNSGVTRHGRRAVILNRPFRNVGELGYAYRDLPFKTLDLFSMASADAALLDVFSITDEPKVVAGRLALSNAPKPVIQSVLAMGSKKDFDPAYNMGAETNSPPPVSTLAQAIANQLQPTSTATGSGPLLNRAGLATQLGANPNTGTGAIYAGLSTVVIDRRNKAYLEAPVRALADVTNTRTWNLMIDIIAQSGHLAQNATSLDNFVVEGEKRYWLHIAIDRYTGRIVDQQLEPVYE